jgi:hypothetical protein
MADRVKLFVVQALDGTWYWSRAISGKETARGLNCASEEAARRALIADMRVSASAYRRMTSLPANKQRPEQELRQHITVLR